MLNLKKLPQYENISTMESSKHLSSPRKRGPVPAFAGMTIAPMKITGRAAFTAFAGMTIALILLIGGCKPAPVQEPVKIQAVKVRVAPVVKQEISVPVRSSGYVAMSDEVKLSFKTGGIVARTYVKEGDAVKSGQLLAALNLSEISAQVNQAKIGFEKAQRDFTRAKNLFADSVATLEQMQNAESALNVSKSILEAANYNLSHSKITAPKAGIILKQLVRENELVASGYPVYALGITGKNWLVRTGLSDRDIVKIQPGDSAKILIDAWPDQPFTAVVSQIDEAANPQTGTYEIELKLVKTEFKLASGFIANVEVLPVQKTTCFLVPVEALMEADGQSGFVFVPGSSGTVRKVKVGIITLIGNQAALTGKLDNVQFVVTEGASYLSDNIAVEIRK
ncbi:MAG TPA: efflux RND transporter periplasmic adaptor subunit [Bacteroidales bacterium]|nr:efflux RND transporter periplasmic adaptor subunit [Bacteroidales bacterium]